jgi:hypothetical protein
MKVYTYYEEIGYREWSELLEIWAESWRMNGWLPVIVGREIIQDHPLLPKLLEKINSMPTINDRSYENACYLRWLAASRLGGLWVDNDVVNVGLSPIDFPEELRCWSGCHGPGCGGSSCVSGGTGKAFLPVLDWIFDWQGTPIIHSPKGDIISDMYLFFDKKPKLMESVDCAFYDNRTAASKIIHCAYVSTVKRGISKIEAMKQLISQKLENNNGRGCLV